MKKSDCWSSEDHKLIAASAGRDLWRFIQKNAAEKTQEDLFLELVKLAYEDLSLLSKIHFMLSDEVERLVGVTAPTVLHRLSKTSAGELHVGRGRLDGRISWGRTYCERAAVGGDPTIFACIRRSSVYDLPENRVLLYMLRKAAFISGSLLGADLNNEKFNTEHFEKQKWAARIGRIHYKSIEHLKNPYMRQIGDLHRLTEKLIEDAERARGHWYTQLAETARMFNKCISSPLDYLQEQTPERILEPLSWDTLYEIAVLFAVISSAVRAGWNEQKIGLIGGASSTVSSLVKNGAVMNIYYQRIPESFTGLSRYGEIMRKCGLSDRLRRPDIVLERIKGGSRHCCIIEVKRSSRRQYLADGAYKLLGYLKDFEKVLNSDVLPIGLLVGWSGIKSIPPAFNSEIHTASWDILDRCLDEIMRTYD